MLSIFGILTQQEVTAAAREGNDEAERLKAFSDELQYRQHENLVTQLSEIHKKLTYVSRVSAVVGTASVFLALIDVEHSFGDYEHTKTRVLSSDTGTALRVCSSLLTVCLLVTVVKFHRLDYQRLRTRKKAAGPLFQHSPQCASMLVEVGLFAVHCPPGCNVEFEFNQLRGVLALSVLEVTTVVMFGRLYLVLRGVRFSSRWGTLTVEDSCNEYGCHSGTLFMLKSYFQSSPYFVLTVSFLSSLLFFSLIIRILERPYAIDNGTGQNYVYTWNALWMVVITMFTVGYGDFYPQTHLGRALVVLACLWGMFLISMLVVQMARATVHSKEESGAYFILSRLWKKREIRPAAGKVLLCAFRYHCNRGTYSDLLDSLIAFKHKKQSSNDESRSVRDALHLFEENVTIDLDELMRLSSVLQALNDRLKQVETTQLATSAHVVNSIAHVSAILKELRGSEVIRRG